MSYLPNVSPKKRDIFGQNAAGTVFNSSLFSKINGPIPKNFKNHLPQALPIQKYIPLQMLENQNCNVQEFQLSHKDENGSKTARHHEQNHFEVPLKPIRKIKRFSVCRTELSPDRNSSPKAFLLPNSELHQNYRPGAAQVRSQFIRSPLVQPYPNVPNKIILPALKTHKKSPSQPNHIFVEHQLEKQEKLLKGFIDQWDQQIREDERNKNLLFETRLEELELKTKIMEQKIKKQAEQRNILQKREARIEIEPDTPNEKSSFLMRVLERSIIELMVPDAEKDSKKTTISTDFLNRNKKLKKHIVYKKNELDEDEKSNSDQSLSEEKLSSIKETNYVKKRSASVNLCPSNNHDYSLNAIENQSLTNLNDKPNLNCANKTQFNEEDETDSPKHYSIKKRKIRVKSSNKKVCKRSYSKSVDLTSYKNTLKKSLERILN